MYFKIFLFQLFFTFQAASFAACPDTLRRGCRCNMACTSCKETWNKKSCEAAKIGIELPEVPTTITFYTDNSCNGLSGTSPVTIKELPYSVGINFEDETDPPGIIEIIPTTLKVTGGDPGKEFICKKVGTYKVKCNKSCTPPPSS